MKLKHLLALAILAIGGGNLWAEDVTIGATDNTTAYLAAKSEAFALNGNGTWKFNFTNYNAGTGFGYNNFVLNANNGTADVFNLRADQFEAVAWNNANITRPGYTWTDDATFVADMNGAEVDMTVSRIGNVIYVNSTITPATGTAPFKYNYRYNAASGNLNLHLSVDHSYLVLHEAKEYASVYAADFENEATYKDGWTINGDLGPTWAVCSGTQSHYIWMKNGSSGNRAFSISFAENNNFMTAEDYRFEFDFNYGGGNSNATANTVIVNSNNSSSKLFTLEKTATAWSGQFNILDAAGNTLTATVLPGTVDYKNPFAFFYHFLVEGIKDDGVYLTVSNGDEEKLARVKVADFAPVTGFSSNMGKNMVGVGFDNIIFSMHSENEIIPDPSAIITGVDGTNRTVTLSLGDGSTVGSTLYYSDNSDGSLATLYTAPVVVSESKTLYFYTLSAKGNKSAIQSIDIDCSNVVLAAPTYVKGAYVAGVTTVTLNANESGVLLNPTVTIHYSTSAGAQGDIANGASIDVADGVTVTAYAKADGYTNSSNLVFTTVAPCSYMTIVNETYNGRVSGNWGFSLGAESDDVPGYFTLTYNDGEVKTVSDHLLVQQLKGGGNDLMRAYGVYFAAGTNVAIPNLSAGDVITFNGVWGNGEFYVNGTNNVVKDEWNSNQGSKYVFTVVADGAAYFNIARYGYTQSLTIQSDLASATMAVSAAAKYGTFCAPFDVVMPAGVYAFTANVDGNAVTLTEEAAPAETLSAHTPVVLKAEGGLAATNFYGKAVAGTPTAGDLIGVYELTATPAGAYLLQMNGGVVGFYNVDGLGTHVGANRCYLTSTSGARAFLLGGEETAIETVKTAADEVVFDLAGRKVMNAKKGLYIVNGKKVIR